MMIKVPTIDGYKEIDEHSIANGQCEVCAAPATFHFKMDYIKDAYVLTCSRCGRKTSLVAPHAEFTGHVCHTGTLPLTASGLRKLANAIDKIYPAKTQINMPIWKLNSQGLMAMQLGKDTGEIDLIKGEEDQK